MTDQDRQEIQAIVRGASEDIKVAIADLDTRFTEKLQGTEARFAEKLQGTETRFTEKLQETESRLRENIHDTEVRFTEKLQETENRVRENIHDTETRLLRGFYDHSRSSETRMRKLEADHHNLDTAATQRLALLEQKVLELEKRLIEKGI
jgi:hypothetical protein